MQEHYTGLLSYVSCVCRNVLRKCQKIKCLTAVATRSVCSLPATLSPPLLLSARVFSCRNLNYSAVHNQMACLVRVPTENVKQKMQAGLHGTAAETVNAILKTGGVRGFYTGYLTTVVREIPFSFIQFPIYEWLKVT